jgi:hypothetical protein
MLGNAHNLQKPGARIQETEASPQPRHSVLFQAGQKFFYFLYFFEQIRWIG